MTVHDKRREMHLGDRISDFATPTFVISLTLLIVNDWYLKARYPGWITGKLSDFAGLIVFSLILFSLARRHIRALAALVSVLFVWWKSSYSQGFIDAFNALGPLQVGRTVDYTDLAALAVVPWSVRLFETRERWQQTTGRWRNAMAVPIGFVALLAVSGTSMVPYTREFFLRETDEHVVLSHDAVVHVLAGVAESDEFECRPGDAGTVCQIDDIWLTYDIEDGRVKFRVAEPLPMLGSGRRAMRNVDALIEEIKVAFSREFSGLEYVEPLIGRTPRGAAAEK